jgi:hypothetical protein
MYKLRNLLESLYIPLWILKDFMWFMSWGIISFIFAIPTILISVILIGYSSGLQKKQHIIFGLWAIANTLWMAYECFKWNTNEIAGMFYVVSIFLIIIVLPEITAKYLKD